MRGLRWLGGLAVGASVLVLASAGASAAGDTFRVSVSSGGAQANNSSVDAAISGNGNLVVFKSLATNLVPNDTNGVTPDIYLRNRSAGTTTLVSVDQNGNQFTQASEEPAISFDGSTVAWETGGEIYVRKLPNGPTQLVSKDSSGNPGDAASHAPQLSADGRYVTYWSNANNIVANDPKFTGDVFVYDTQTGTNELDSVSSNGSPAAVGQDSYLPSISGDGRYVVFETKAPFSPIDTNGVSDVYVHDRQTGTTTLVSHNPAGTSAGDAQSFEGNGGPKISEDGSTIVFTSDAGNLVPNDTNLRSDVFVYHMATGKLEQASVNSSGVEGTQPSSRATVNSDGSLVAFESSNQLSPWDTGTNVEIYVRHVATQTTSMESTSAQGQWVSGDKLNPSIDGDGSLVAYHSAAGSLVTGDTNGVEDVFVHQLGIADTTPPTVTGTPTPAANGNGWYNQNVTVNWSAVDPQPSSGQPAAMTPTVVSTEGANQTVTSPPACDGNLNCATGSVTLSIDKTPPSVAVALTPPNSYGWYSSPVTVGFTCTDLLSGIASCPGALQFNGEGANQTVPASQRTATDKAGNTTVASVPGINIDLTPPVITYSGPQNYDVNQTVGITCNATDALSGVASSTCTNVDGPASVFNFGTNVVSSSATDKAGNVGSGTYTFTVTPTISGLESYACSLLGSPPLHSDPPVSNRLRNLCRQLTQDLDFAQADAASGNTKQETNDIRKFLKDASNAVGSLINTQQMLGLTRIANWLLPPS
jgi:hypothetical protein